MRVALTPGAGCCAIRLMPKFGGASSALTPYTSATEGATASSGCSAEPHSRSPDAAGRPEGWQAQRGAIPPTGARSRLRCGNAGPRSEIKKPRGASEKQVDTATAAPSKSASLSVACADVYTHQTRSSRHKRELGNTRVLSPIAYSTPIKECIRLRDDVVLVCENLAGGSVPREGGG
ncbi:hypothetical protein MRX96_057697 [Rhipicephalus microplus]